ncbi:MAG TPA: PQQ-dependent sugar dehydrogenase [Thermoanaerobaculia bacterium]|jgi:glucose/arabinose dehydrogenase|nr:PQQ-dependent sugar dehydrogenase [Thermoanaerobaculia bacterium]
MAAGRRAAARIALLAALALGCGSAAVEGLPASLDRIVLPPGFSISFFAPQVPGARSLALSPSGVVYVGTRDDVVYALPDRDRDGHADSVQRIASGLHSPNGVAFRDGSLYVAEVHRILRYDDIEKHLDHAPAPKVIYDRLPHDEHHGWKYLRFGPDGWLWFGIGAPCNICEPADPYASIARLAADGSRFEVWARGIRNTVGFDWQPGSNVLWFTDNGRDWLGDDRPPDELDRAPRSGMHFGYPYCHGGDIADPEFGRKRPCSDFTPPAVRLDPHVAAIGMRFYRGTMFPAPYRGAIFIAEHGSWNRTEPIGYRLMVVEVDGDRASRYRPFASGWLQGGHAWGRPVDVLEMPDGALLVSDDHLGAVYRITYHAR